MSISRNQKKSSRRTSPICFGPVKNLTVLFKSASLALRTLSPNVRSARSHSRTMPSHVSGMGGMFLGGNLSSPSTACAPPKPSNTNVQASSFALRALGCGFKSALAAGYAFRTLSVVGTSRSQVPRNCSFSVIAPPLPVSAPSGVHRGTPCGQVSCGMIYTVGHSTRELDDFLDLLEAHGVRQVVDVRRYPASRRHPHFARDALAVALQGAGIAYHHEGDLGGRRTARPDSANTAWRSAAWPARLPAAVLVIAGLVMVAGLGWVDFVTGPDLTPLVFYVAPVVLVSWYAGRWPGAIIACAAGLAWMLADALAQHDYSDWSIPYWNAALRLAALVLVSEALARLRLAHARERELARSDVLTGAPNARAFYEVAEAEIARPRRYTHPFSVAYLDLDDFKLVNDRLGHLAGDAVLRSVARALSGVVRSSDVVARLGGDEFVVLLHSAGGAPAG